MKTTVELPDALFREAKQYAAGQGIPLREVFEQGLRAVLEGQTITTTGHGLVCDGDWETIRSLIYEGHGGW